MPVSITVPKEKWTGTVCEVRLGATSAEGGTRARQVVVGGETTLPFLHFEGHPAHPPAVAVEVKSIPPTDWSPLLAEA
jgi:acetyl-CoA decarbonylase/synthase complex subunit delta